MSFAAIRRRRGGALASAYVPPVITGNYARFAPRYAALPTGITFNGTTGRYDGTVLDTTEPTWAVTNSSLTDTGNAATNASNLNALIGSYASSMTQNTRILVPYTSQHRGEISLPSNTTGFWLGIYTSHYSSLPALSPGTSVGTKSANRVNASHLAHMPEFYGSYTNESCFNTISATSQKFFVRGMSATNRLGFVNDGSMFTAWSGYPSDIIFAQVAADGGGYAGGVRRACNLGGQRLAFIDSYIDNVGQAVPDCQGVLIFPGVGPYKQTNCYMKIGGAAENFLVGGYGLPGTDATYLPADIEVRGNYFDKPFASGLHKNHVEVKLGRRILVEGNACSGHNGGGQQVSIVIKLTDQSSPNTATDTTDVTVANNRVLDGPGGIVVTGGEFYSGTNTTRRVDIKNNVIMPLTVFPGRGLVFGSGNTGPINTLDVQWNTVIGAPASINTYAPAVFFNNSSSATAMTLKNNALVGADGCGSGIVNGSDGGNGEAGYAACVSSGVFLTNLINSTSGFPHQIPVANLASMGFVNAAGGDYALSGASAGHAAGDGGFDVGADFSLNTAIISGVV